MSLLSCVGMTIAAGLVVFTTYANAQMVDSSASRVIIQDSIVVARFEGDPDYPPSWVSPSYSYMMSYGSTSNTMFTFTECKLNGSLVKLLAWNYNRVVSAPAELISYNSRTANFQVHSGDTISFYREMEWYNPTTNRQDTNNYYALDTLEMVTYLVNADDGSPLAQLDSLGVLPRLSPGMPVMYGTRPIMALVSYAVPQSLDGDSVLIGITMKARGSGSDHFMRHDAITIGLSERLKDAAYQNYLADIAPMYARRSIDELMEAAGGESVILKATAVSGSPRDVRISFNGPDNGGPTSIMIYDEMGNLLFSPYTSRIGTAASETFYRAPGSGAYFVTLAHNGRIVKTQKIIVPQ